MNKFIVGLVDRDHEYEINGVKYIVTKVTEALAVLLTIFEPTRWSKS